MIEDRFLKSGRVCVGVDEVGRGCLAGPISAAAYALTYEDVARIPKDLVVRDSKKMTQLQRERTQNWAASQEHVRALAHSEADEIDQKGISYANRMVMTHALQQVLLDLQKRNIPESSITIVIDHVYLQGLQNYHVINAPRAESASLAVALASIWAKVYRDMHMNILHKEHPTYGWYANKGYGTAQHREAIQLSGPTRYHRKTFLKNFTSSAQSA